MKKIKYKEYEINNFFYGIYGNTDLKQIDIDNKGVPVITSGIQNNGIMGLSSKDAKIIRGKSITVDMFGNVRYRDFNYKMVTHGRVFALIPNKSIKFDEEIGLYFATCVQRITHIFSYDNMCSWNKIKNMSIMLPVEDNTNTIDYDYMKSYIKMVKRRSIKKLKEFLVSNGYMS